MTANRMAVSAIAAAVLIVAGCATETSTQVSSGAPSETVTGTAGTVAPIQDANLVPTDLTGLARQTIDQLSAERTLDGPMGDPEAWQVIVEVDLPLDDADLESPMAALPAPFDGLRLAVTSIKVKADGPDYVEIIRLDQPFVDLRSWLDGSRQIATTVPGDTAPPTETWLVTNPRITELWVNVVDFDMVTTGPEIVALVGPERLRLGPPGGWTPTTVADARRGVAVSFPPSTGTSLPSTSPTT